MKVLVCGSRKWTERDPIERELRKLPGGTIIIHGAAPGADTIADLVARELGFEVHPYPADWKRNGKAAGPIRNAYMLKCEHVVDDPINLVLAFAKDFSPSRAPGTADMMKKSRAKCISVEPFSV
jgi:hypothetical protein